MGVSNVCVSKGHPRPPPASYSLIGNAIQMLMRGELSDACFSSRFFFSFTAVVFCERDA